MRKYLALAMALITIAALQPGQAAAGEVQPLGRLVALQGAVDIGRDGAWNPGRMDQPLFEAESIRTGPQAGARILFQGDLAVDVSAGAEFKVSDLFFKARLGKLKNRVSSPDGASRTEMTVVPLTGVRGTEQEMPKSDEPRRPHFWSDDANEGP
jgi:hypothetical protein